MISDDNAQLLKKIKIIVQGLWGVIALIWAKNNDPMFWETLTTFILLCSPIVIYNASKWLVNYKPTPPALYLIGAVTCWGSLFPLYDAMEPIELEWLCLIMPIILYAIRLLDLVENNINALKYDKPVFYMILALLILISVNQMIIDSNR